MQALAENLLNDKWRSFKTFYAGGDIRLHTKQSFTEALFNEGKRLTVNFHNDGVSKTLLSGERWELQLKQNRHYLWVPAHKLRYEVITVNHTVLVLHDLQRDEKIFFARNVFWDDFLASNHEVIL